MSHSTRFRSHKVATSESLPFFLTVPKIQVAVGKYKPADVLAAVARLHKGAATTRMPLRTAEYKQLTAAPLEVPGDLPSRDDAFFARRLKLGAPPAGVCHGCLFIAEPSCERYNRYLDRALVIPSLGHAEGLAYFRAPP